MWKKVVSIYEKKGYNRHDSSSGLPFFRKDSLTENSV